MRVLVAGADGVRALGAEPRVADALDRDDLLRAANGLTADAVIHELTSLRKPPLRPNGMAVTSRVRHQPRRDGLDLQAALRGCIMGIWRKSWQ
jgi:uncharacterized protein YbjT (DUF2867 family)